MAQILCLIFSFYHSRIIMQSYLPHKNLSRIACIHGCECTLLKFPTCHRCCTNELPPVPVLHGILYPSPHRGQGRPPLSTRDREMWTEQCKALQVAGRRGSCTHKEIIDTGLFMLVGKGAWIWIKPCVHFANYPASVLKEKRAYCRFSSQFQPMSLPHICA